jgi:hypothetical protein
LNGTANSRPSKYCSILRKPWAKATGVSKRMVWSSRKDFSGTNLISLTSVFAALRAENDLKNVYDAVERVITSEFDFCGDGPTSGPPKLGLSPTTECRCRVLMDGTPKCEDSS